MSSNRSTGLFRFQRFSMTHARSPMKIGTDGVLLGAWCDGSQARWALDAGTGCGLIALMLAQRYPLLQVEGIDIDPGAVADARENFAGSPFAERLSVRQGDVLTTDFPRRYDLIVSNPPFFTEDTLPPEASRAAARHAVHLPAEAFARKITQILAPSGRVALIYPYREADRIVGFFAAEGLYLARRTDVRGGAGRPLKRSLLEFSFAPVGAEEVATDTLQLCEENERRSARYRELTRGFHPDTPSL